MDIWKYLPPFTRTRVHKRTEYVETFPPLQLLDNSDTNTLRLGFAKADICMTQRPVVLFDSLSASSVSIYLHLH